MKTEAPHTHMPHPPKEQTVESFVAKTVELNGTLVPMQFSRMASYALGMLAGAAISNRVVFSNELMLMAFNCDSMADVSQVEALIDAQTKGAEVCGDCGGPLVHVAGPNVRGVLCPVCDADSMALGDDENPQ